MEQRVSPAVGSSVEPQKGEEATQTMLVKKAKEYKEINHLKGHKYGIECIRFSPRNDFLISLGDPNDRGLFVWDWKNEKKISANKLTKPATAVAISPEQDYFVTGGYQHLKYWYLDDETGQPITKKQSDNLQILESVSADLTKVKEQIFVGLTIQCPRIFALTSDGHIYVFDK